MLKQQARHLTAEGYFGEAKRHLCLCRWRNQEAPYIALCLPIPHGSLAESILSFPGHLHCRTHLCTCPPSRVTPWMPWQQEQGWAITVFRTSYQTLYFQNRRIIFLFACVGIILGGFASLLLGEYPTSSAVFGKGGSRLTARPAVDDIGSCGRSGPWTLLFWLVFTPSHVFFSTRSPLSRTLWLLLVVVLIPTSSRCHTWVAGC